tara:strand:+ start:1103 stop:1516 length:414 start_codon:yes stop_codon:yes gene_type:complete
MEIDNLHINEGDFDLFVELEPRQKLEFLWDAQYVGLEASVLKQIERMDKQIDQVKSIPKTIVTDFEVGNTRLCVTIFNDIIYLNSNSLKAINQFVKKLWLDGHVLTSIKDADKTIHDIYKYFKAFRILGKGNPFSEN